VKKPRRNSQSGRGRPAHPTGPWGQSRGRR
jgi:hypothetical protein